MTEPRMQVLAIISAQSTPITALESLDAIFASAVFDIALSVLFLDETIKSHLLTPTGHNTDRQLAKQWAASDLYDINALWVLKADLAALALAPETMPTNVQLLEQLPDLSHFKHVLSL